MDDGTIHRTNTRAGRKKVKARPDTATQGKIIMRAEDKDVARLVWTAGLWPARSPEILPLPFCAWCIDDSESKFFIFQLD